MAIDIDVPYGAQVVLHVHEVDDSADAVVNGQVFAFDEPSGNIDISRALLRNRVNSVKLRVHNTGNGLVRWPGQWSGRFSIYVAGQQRPFDEVGGDDYEKATTHVALDLAIRIVEPRR